MAVCLTDLEQLETWLKRVRLSRDIAQLWLVEDEKRSYRARELPS